jgi:hypothetical protein
MAKENILSVVLPLSSPNWRKKAGEFKFVPFRGDFPLCDRLIYDKLWKLNLSNKFVSDLPLMYQRIALAGYKIWIYEQDFLNWLQVSTKETKSSYLELSKEKKSNLLAMWMDKRNIDIGQLTIKIHFDSDKNFRNGELNLY